ncbi:hypothetical protein GQ457_05G019040 [Hibiscus cannabinus]
MADLKGISPTICMHKIMLEECHSNSVEPQRRLNPAMMKVVMKEIIKRLDAGVIYPISDSSWVSHVQCVPKKGGITVVTNDENELLPIRTVTGWRICMDYRKLNKATKKDHFPLPFIDQMMDRLAGKEFYCFLDGYSGYNQMHKITLEECHSNSVEPQRRLNPAMMKVVMKENIKRLDAGVIYPISDSSWVSPVQCVPKKGGITVVTNDENELLPIRTVTGWRICMDYRKLNKATKKDHFPLPFIDQMLDRLAGKEFYCFLDGYSGYNQIAIAPEDQEKTTFTCPYGTYAFRRMPFGLCNAPATFQRCMLAIFSDMVEEYLEVFMEDFSVSGETFDSC